MLAEADLRLAVTQAYAEAVAADRRQQTAADQAQIAAAASRAARVRVDAGRASPIEVQRADVERHNADAQDRQARRQAEVARQHLTRLIGAPADGPLDGAWFQAIPAVAAKAAGRDSLELAIADADLAGVRLAQSQRVPDLTLGAGVRRLQNSDSTAAVFSVSVPVPLFNGGRAALSGARAERDAAEARQRQARLELERAIAQTQADAADAAVLAETATGPALAAAEEAARIARIGYTNGKFGQLELLDAERTLAKTRTAAIDALLATHIAMARLERLTARAPFTQPEPGN